MRNNHSSHWRDKNVSSEGSPLGEVAEITIFPTMQFAGKKAVFYQNISKSIFPFEGKNSCEGGESDAAAAVKA